MGTMCDVDKRSRTSLDICKRPVDGSLTSANGLRFNLQGGLTSLPGTLFRYFLNAHSRDDFWKPHLSPPQYQPNDLHSLTERSVT